ncbi:DUF4198 domain-containing protein [Confluentibacter sediminis]|uniref:DUF4198 domain-containing protein n=1 Tax=Confluentibacter sediminis TaxID=2219045 RepID=UPI000DADEA96|nr:DUF4198 domain-containing protein [Confluentibacter sediminis]
MKKIILTALLIVFTTSQMFAHYLWIETNKTGMVGVEQDVKIYYGEYTYGEIEKVNGEAFPKVKNFTLWIIDEKGNRTTMETTAFEDYYLAKFKPAKNGTFTIALNNNEIDVLDYTKYNFGIFKTHYHATAKIQVGQTDSETLAVNEIGITIKDVSKNKDQIKLQVLFKNKLLPENEVHIYVSDLWSKTLKTDEKGFILFKLPWDTKYIIEATIKEEVPGTYKGEAYQFIWHCGTYCIL